MPVIERVARAICASCGVDPDQVGGTWDGGSLPKDAPAWTAWIGQAEQAIAAYEAGS